MKTHKQQNNFVFEEHETIIKPKRVIYKNGKYFVRVFDYVTNTNRTIDFPVAALEEINTFKTGSYPTFQFIEVGTSTETFATDELLQAIGEAEATNNFIRIKYRNSNGIVSTRTLKDYEIKSVTFDTRKMLYLKGFCLSCNDERTFKISDIQKI